MKKYDSQKPLISIHIPKCGGTSFSDTLKAWFGKGFLRHYPDEINNKSPKKYNLYRGIINKRFKAGLCIHGHFNKDRGYGIEDYYPHLNQLITIIRDPFELHLSNYFFVKREASRGKAYRNGKLHPIIENKWNLKDYLKNEKQSYILSFFPSEISIHNYKQILDDRFLYIGIVEDLPKSISNLAKIIGYPSRRVPFKNRSIRDEIIPVSAREEFSKNNKLEMAIYEYVYSKYASIPS